MENKIATFDNTVAILVKAYLEGTLIKGDYQACAVGNICATAKGLRVVNATRFEDGNGGAADWSDGSGSAWDNLFTTWGGEQSLYYQNPWHSKEVNADAYREIEATGYTVEQLARVEFAFETAAPGYTEEDEYAGLMAVVDVLADIHGIDLTSTEAAKALFVRAA